ncbi:MAG: winged helix DNA-binding domain-containing protein [Solirubrobacteraceae bacterium]
MADELTWPAVMAWRVERQGLAGRAAAERWPEVVRRICGLHAQLPSSAELTLWARVEDLPRDALETALWTDRTLVKTWAMRGTLHLLDASELGLWVGAQGALKPRYEMASWRKAFGMTSEEAAAVLDAIATALEPEPLMRDGLADAVAEMLGSARLGAAVRGSWGTMPKLAAFRGDLCFAPSQGRHVRFTRPDLWLERFERAAPREAMAEVVRRYLAVYGPATREAFARWFGMPSAAQAGREMKRLGDEVALVSLGGQEMWMLAADVEPATRAEPAGVVNLLPAFDQYVVAAPRDGSAVIDAEHKAHVYRPQGWLSPVLLVDGRIVGVWRHELGRGRLTVRIEPFHQLDAAVRDGAAAEGLRLARYLGGELELTFGPLG